MVTIKCPFLNEAERCSIYETRPLCCRSFPNRNAGMFCAQSKCDEDCVNCKDKCCNHIYVEKKEDNVLRALSVTCAECSNKEKK